MVTETEKLQYQNDGYFIREGLFTAKEMDELSEKFEDIEDEIFGGDGFEAAVTRMNEIEQSLGLANLEMFTAPPPPAHS